MSSEISRIETNWKHEISTLSYVGELALEKAELDNLCKELGSNATKRRVALTVLAVNCAYYYLDHDGFWPHLCSRLGLPLTSATTAKLGDQIEIYLKSIRKLSRQRYGTYRYVGAILEQCGITRKQLPRFVDFLKDLEKQYGWDGILGLDYSRYKSHVPNVGSKYLLGFLNDEAGWEFTRDVGRNLSQRDRGIVETSELEKLRGYHPSFWGEVIGLLKLPPPKVKSRNIPLPLLIFDVISRSIQIRLDYDLTLKSSYRLDGKIINTSMTSLRFYKEEDFRDSYPIEVLVDDAWLPISLIGWTPKSSPYAFFHEIKGYIQDTDKLKPGNYWVIAIKSMAIPNEIVLSNHGTLSLFCGYFSIYEVCIEQDTDLSMFGVSGALSKTPYLSYLETCKRLECSADVRIVFTDLLPTILVNNHDSLITGDYILVADVQGQQRRVNLQLINNSTIDLEALGFKVPGKGSLWIEATSRSAAHAGERIIDRLDFVVIKQCKIDGPNYLVSNEENVELELVGPDTYCLELAEGKRLAEDGTRWMVEPNIRMAEGTLEAGNITVRIAYRLFRANMLLPNNADTIFSDDLDSGLTICTEGVPRTAPGLYLAYASGCQKICSPGEFNKAGRNEFSSFSFRDAVLSKKPIAGRFEIGRPGGTVKTSTYYLDIDKACANISLADSVNYNAAWHGYLSPVFEGVFRFLHSIALHGSIERLNIDLDALPHQINTITNTFVSCARVFDGANIDFSSQEVLQPSVNKILAWYVDASVLANGDTAGARDLVNRYSGSIGIPLDRWKNCLELKFVELQHLVMIEENADEVLREWATEVRGLTRMSYSGHIAKLCFGKQLVDCWRLYFKHNKSEQSCQVAIKIADQTDGLVGELARLLAMLMLVKLGQAEEAAIYSNVNCNSFLLPFFEALIGRRYELTADALNTIPIRSEDLELFQKDKIY